MQLTLLGYILVPIFTYNQWWLVLVYACFMLYVGCLEASQRPAYSYTVSTPITHTPLHRCQTHICHRTEQFSCQPGAYIQSCALMSYTVCTSANRLLHWVWSMMKGRHDCRGCLRKF